MDFEQLASLVKFVAGTGILVTLVYLVGQLRQRNQLTHRAPLRPFGPLGGGGGAPPMDPRRPDDLARQSASLEVSHRGENPPRSDPESRDE